ncbi:MAG: hypothetical protein ACRC8K_18240 [Waterburya sp.]
MLSQVALVFASCLAVSGCTNNSTLESQSNFINTQSSNYIQQTAANKAIREPNIAQNKPESLVLAEQPSLNLKEIGERKNGAISYSSPPLSISNYDGFWWWNVNYHGYSGWARADYICEDPQ